MHKRCPNPTCNGTLNPSDAVVCVRCDADLTYAEEVYGAVPAQDTSLVSNGAGIAPPTGDTPVAQALRTVVPATATATATHDVACDCPAPRPLSADPTTCWACRRPIRLTAHPSSSEQPVPGAAAISLALPGGVSVSVGAGLLLGRDIRVAPAPMQTLMAAYPGLSRAHAWIGSDGRQITVIDLGSRNGTWVGSHRLTPGAPFAHPVASLPVTLRMGQSFSATVEQERSA